MPQHLRPRVVHVTTSHVPGAVLPVQVTVLTTIDTAEATATGAWSPWGGSSSGLPIAERAAQLHCAGRPVSLMAEPGQYGRRYVDAVGHELVQTRWRCTDQSREHVEAVAQRAPDAVTSMTYGLHRLDHDGGPIT